MHWFLAEAVCKLGFYYSISADLYLVLSFFGIPNFVSACSQLRSVHNSLIPIRNWATQIDDLLNSDFVSATRHAQHSSLTHLAAAAFLCVAPEYLTSSRQGSQSLTPLSQQFVN